MELLNDHPSLHHKYVARNIRSRNARTAAWASQNRNTWADTWGKSHLANSISGCRFMRCGSRRAKETKGSAHPKPNNRALSLVRPWGNDIGILQLHAWRPEPAATPKWRCGSRSTLLMQKDWKSLFQQKTAGWARPPVVGAVGYALTCACCGRHRSWIVTRG